MNTTHNLAAGPLVKTDALDRLTQAAVVIAGSLLIALSAQIAIIVPISPVPITAQTFAVLLVAMLLGKRLGTAAVIAYLIEGAAGLPFFAMGGAGPLHLVGPTGGYLLGFVPAALLVGHLADRGWSASPTRTLLAMTIGTGVIFISGVSWLAMAIGLEPALVAGCWPYLPGAIIKIVAATLIVQSWAHVTRHFIRRGR